MVKTKIDKGLLFLIILLSITSIITIYSANNILPLYLQNLYIKQFLWYILGYIIIIFILKINIEKIYSKSWLIYIIGNILLLLLLFFGKEINGAKCWFQIYGIGTIQPSEFMKISLIIILSNQINKFNKKKESELIFLLKVLIILLPPCILTFLEPDTGNVIIYLLIAVVILLVGGIDIKWFYLLFFILCLIIGTITFLYFIDINSFKELFGDDFFLRINRILDWTKKDGYQLEKSLVSIGSSGFLGNGINKTPLYFPEAQTDFIFAVFASSFGFFGSLILIITLMLFDLKIIEIAKNTKNYKYKYFIAGVISMLIFQQFQNISMTFGIMPITGITLPLISYGGSNLLIFMITMGIILNISKKTTKY